MNKTTDSYKIPTATILPVNSSCVFCGSTIGGTQTENFGNENDNSIF